MKWWEEVRRGLWSENPTFRIMIGMCPTLAVTTAAINGVAMGLSTLFVLIGSSTMISALRQVIPEKVRIPCYIVVIATFVTVVDLVMAAFFSDLHRVLGLYIPLIVVNCIIMGRAEAYASRMPVPNAFLDAVGMGLGFTWALTLLGGIRELLGFGSLFGVKLTGSGFTPWVVALLPPGGFLTMGIVLGAINAFTARQAVAAGSCCRTVSAKGE